MDIVTPGLIFLLRGTTRFLLPSILSYVICHILDHAFHIYIPPLARAAVFIAIGPFSIWLAILLDNVNCRLEAKKFATQLAPVWKGRRVGNFDVLLKIMHDFRVGYPGEE